MVLTGDELMAGVDFRRMNALRHKYRHGPQKNPSWLKFADWRQYAPRAIGWAEQLELHKSRGKRIIDVGCEFGYFVRACQLMGHNAIGLDFDDPLYNEVWDILKVPAVHHALTCGVPLPKGLGDFDIITMFGFGLPRVSMGDGHRSARTWEEYQQSLLALLKLVKPGGFLFAVLNVGRDWLFGNSEWYALAKHAGGILSVHNNIFRIDMP